MDINDLFINRAGRVRSVWRLAVFVVACILISMVLSGLVALASALLLPRETFTRLLEGYWGWVLQQALIFAAAALAGWGCGFTLEDLPWRALGWMTHRGWGRDLLLGLLVGAASLGGAALVGALFGGYRFALAEASALPSVLKTFASSAFILMLGAAAEEMLLRGYPLQTLVRSWPLWVPMLLTSIVFAVLHRWNPNVAPGFTFINTALAGAWFVLAFWRTRSLWFPFGLHWGWNWTMGAIIGSPISGITTLAPHPLLRFESAGPEWLAGSAYGIEGGAACTLALVVSIIFVWRTSLLSATEELRLFTDGENPNPASAPLSNFLAPSPQTPSANLQNRSTDFGEER